MFLVEEKMGSAAVDEEDEAALVLWRLGAGALLVPVVCSDPLLVDIFWKRGFGHGFGFQDSLFDDFAVKELMGRTKAQVYLGRIERKQEKKKKILFSVFV